MSIKTKYEIPETVMVQVEELLNEVDEINGVSSFNQFKNYDELKNSISTISTFVSKILQTIESAIKHDVPFKEFIAITKKEGIPK